MIKYFKETKLRYPPVCSEELLNGNPYGLVIPNTLIFEKFKNWRKDLMTQIPKSNKLLILNDNLPLIKVNRIVEKILENRAKRYGNI